MILIIITNSSLVLFSAYSEVYCVSAVSFCVHDIIGVNPVSKLLWKHVVPFIELKWLMRGSVTYSNDKM